MSHSSNPPRLLVLAPDEATIARMASVFGAAIAAAHQSLSELRACDLSAIDVAICASSLRDGSGLDALAHLQSTRADLPAIMLGHDQALAIQAIRRGALDVLMITGPDDYNRLPLAVEKCLVHQRVKHENEQLQHNLRRSLVELAETNNQLQSVIHQLEAMARTDELTGLANRRWFNLMLQGHWADATRHDWPLACLMIDLDGFKHVNDSLGHHKGDELLRQAAKVIRANCRDVDVAARYGGDEFCVLIGHASAVESATVAQRIVREFTAATSSACEPPQLSMSIGLAHIDLSRPINADTLVNHADEAMYAAKAAGKNCVMVRGRNSIGPSAATAITFSVSA